MKTNQRFKVYLLLILLTGVGLALAVPALVKVHASDNFDPLSPAASGDIIYVAKSGDDSDGSTWEKAFTDLQDALGEAVSGDQIWVAEGIYVPGSNRTDSFDLVPGVALYGGFRPDWGDDQFEERDWVFNRTILSGDIGEDDNTTYYGLVLTTTDIIGNNSYHVVTADGTSTPITGTTVLDGFTITAGQANGGTVPDNRGGGYYCDGSGIGSECSPRLRNVTFSGNYAHYGGALYNNGPSGTSKTSLKDVTFSGNSAGNSGGAMFNNGNNGDSSPSLEDVIFDGNSAGDFGGAIRNYGQNGDSHPSMRHVIFSDNHADSGGAIASHGSLGASNPSLENVNFSGNSADNFGGAMYNHGSFGTSSPTMTNVIFSGNSAQYGGAMYNDGKEGNSSPSLRNVTFSGNFTEWDGGAVYNDGGNGASSPGLNNVIFSGNSAGYHGGAMYNSGIDGDSSPSLINVTLAGNSAANSGGAMYNLGINGIGSPNLTNIILWGNTAAFDGNQMYNRYASIAITTSLVQGGITGGGVYNDNSTVTDGGGNLDADPDFLRDPDPGPDGDWDGVEDDYGDLHLGSGSPAIDTGSNDAISLPTDLDGNPRVVDGDGNGAATVDMGAYEYNCPAGNILYVDHTASGTGGSWSDAKPDLALGLKLAGYCPDVSQVWVATGVYTPGIHRSDSFQLVQGVAVYGGFDPAGGVDEFSERDWQSHPTILSGDIAGDDTNTDGVVLMADHIVGVNSHHVVMADGSSKPITSITVLDGFTITAGEASESAQRTSGAGLYLRYCSPALENITIVGNYASSSGGGLYNSNSDPSLTNVSISGNSSFSGGGMYNDNSNPSLVNVVISGNSVDNEGGGMKNWDSDPSLVNVTISGNSAGDDGGAIYNSAGSNPVLTNVSISGNYADDMGGGIANVNSSSSAYNSILWNNQDSGGTGTISATIYNRTGAITLTHSIIQGAGGSVDWTSDVSIVDGGNNLDSDPDFIQDVDPSAAPTSSGDLHLKADSPAIDTGDNTYISGYPTDLDGSPRLIDGDLDGTATVDMGAYEFQTYTLTVSLVGSGSGTVTGGGISCTTGSPDAGCIKAYTDGTIVHLTASTSTGSTFTGWSGACNHTDQVCTVAMVDARAVTATFTLEQYPLSVSLAGSGGGSVSSTPPGIDCGTDCTENYDYGSLVSLTAAADPDSNFKGWGGACSGTGACEITISEAISVTAAFDKRFVCLPIILR